MNLIYALSPPYSILPLARRLKRQLKVPLLLDLKDDWIDTPNYHQLPGWVKLLCRRVEARSLAAADLVNVVGNRHACIVDGAATIVKDNRAVLYVWYDNEFGYACQVVRVVQKWAGIKYPLIPSDVAQTGFG